MRLTVHRKEDDKMNEIKEYTDKIFEDIKHVDENGNEYWYAREVMPILEYSKWERFSNAIENAKMACEKSGYNINDHFPGVGKMVTIGSKPEERLWIISYLDMHVI